MQDKLEIDHEPAMVAGDVQVNNFYSKLWKSKGWGGADPNFDEQLRLAAIEDLIQHHVFRGEALKKIVDVGCGRGWLTQQLQRYGITTGIDVVPEAVEIARHLFPNMTFSVANPLQLNTVEFEQYGNADLVVSSEVVEHVQDTDKKRFFSGLAMFVKPRGYLLITTPRGELWKQWHACGHECQPVEQWVSESQLSDLATNTGFEFVARTRVYLPDNNYHSATAWLLTGRIWPRLLSVVKPLREAVVYANSIYQVALFRKGAN